jgi:hypothetical protein
MNLRAAAKTIIIHHNPKAITIAVAIDGRSAGQVPVAKGEAMHICEKNTRQSAIFCFHSATKALTPQKIAKSENQTGMCMGLPTHGFRGAMSIGI